MRGRGRRRPPPDSDPARRSPEQEARSEPRVALIGRKRPYPVLWWLRERVGVGVGAVGFEGKGTTGGGGRVSREGGRGGGDRPRGAA